MIVWYRPSLNDNVDWFFIMIIVKIALKGNISELN